METDQTIHIANEGLRLVMECKVPRFRPGTEYNHMVQQQRDLAKRLALTFPPLLDWIEQHRLTLFAAEPGPAVQEFHKWFVLVYLEQQSNLMQGEFQMSFSVAYVLEIRLDAFDEDFKRILTTSSSIRNWLFHYYGSELAMQGWQSRPGDLLSLYRLFHHMKGHKLDVLFGQKMLTFLENLGKELLGFQGNSEYQQMGILAIGTIMNINYLNQKCTNDVEKILQMVLQLNRTLGETYGEDLWTVIYFSIMSIHVTDTSSHKDLMYNILSLMEAELMKQVDPLVSFSGGILTYLRAMTLLLLLDVPNVDVKDDKFRKLTISGNFTGSAQFRQYVKVHSRPENLRFSIHLRLKIAKMIPRLFVGFSSTCYIDSDACKCLELLTWLTMFPVSQTAQQKHSRAIILKQLLNAMERQCAIATFFIHNTSEYVRDVHVFEADVAGLYLNLHPLLVVVQAAVKELPSSGWLRHYRQEVQIRIDLVFLVLRLLERYRPPPEEDS